MRRSRPCSVGDPVDGTAYCHAAAWDGLAILWLHSLTPAERLADPTCPPSCLKDFDLTTVEAETLVAVAERDANAGIQLALQSGEDREAAFGDSISARRLTLATWIIDGDLLVGTSGYATAELRDLPNGGRRAQVRAVPPPLRSRVHR